MIAVDTFPQLPEDGKKRKKERKRTVVRRAGRKETDGDLGDLYAGG